MDKYAGASSGYIKVTSISYNDFILFSQKNKLAYQKFTLNRNMSWKRIIIKFVKRAQLALILQPLWDLFQVFKSLGIFIKGLYRLFFFKKHYLNIQREVTYGYRIRVDSILPHKFIEKSLFACRIFCYSSHCCCAVMDNRKRFR